jgi:hypothetical protein
MALSDPIRDGPIPHLSGEKKLDPELLNGPKRIASCHKDTRKCKKIK